jgi:hypothetical protein
MSKKLNCKLLSIVLCVSRLRLRRRRATCEWNAHSGGREEQNSILLLLLLFFYTAISVFRFLIYQIIAILVSNSFYFQSYNNNNKFMCFNTIILIIIKHTYVCLQCLVIYHVLCTFTIPLLILFELYRHFPL